jgi:hypothetical protein
VKLTADEISAFGIVLGAFARELGAVLLAGNQDGWIDQVSSPLGRRRHCVAVRRRVAERAGGAAVLGRRHVLSREALTEELARKPEKKAKPAAKPSVGDELRAELRLVRGGG